MDTRYSFSLLQLPRTHALFRTVNLQKVKVLHEEAARDMIIMGLNAISSLLNKL